MFNPSNIVLTADLLAEQAEAKALADFKASRQSLLDNAVVEANGFLFDADEASIGRLMGRMLSLVGSPPTTLLLWSLADTPTGVMTEVTLADITLAHKLAVENMSSIWSIE